MYHYFDTLAASTSKGRKGNSKSDSIIKTSYVVNISGVHAIPDCFVHLTHMHYPAVKEATVTRE